MIDYQTVHLSWSWQLSSLPNELWSYLTDTNYLFKKLGQPSIRRSHITQSVDPDLIQLSYNSINRYETWEEEPYEWEYPYRFGVVRHYRSGPYKDLKLQFDLQKNSRGTMLKAEIKAKPRYKVLSFLATLKLKTLFKNRLKKVVHSFDRLACEKLMPYQQEKKQTLVRGGKNRLQQIKEELYNSQTDTEIVDKLIDYIHRADDLHLQRISLPGLAGYWGVSEAELFKVFIYATKANLLNFNWDLYCPYCRNIRQSVKTLNQIHEPIYCDECEQNYNINFNKTVQLSFTPHPLIRKISDENYCTRGPGQNSHNVIQQYLRPGEKRYLYTELPAGTYILRGSQSKGTAKVHVDEDGDSTVHVKLNDTGFSGENVSLACDPNLSIENSSDKNQLLTLEQKNWKPAGVSAARATSFQLFRNLFADEVLRKGEKISVDNLTLMFTDLFDSTGIYNKEGDDKAVGHVIDHFEILQQAVAKEDGAIVKTIGDSVMAVFGEPEQGLRAYLRARKIFSEDNRFDDDFQLKAGIHHGSCVAANLNSRIDYFGSTVNIASRFVDYATESEVIISEEIFEKQNLQQVLDKYDEGHSIEEMNILLKGFEQESFRIKRIQIDDSPLRLAI